MGLGHVANRVGGMVVDLAVAKRLEIESGVLGQHILRRDVQNLQILVRGRLELVRSGARDT
jgi:hypothetical protein